MNAFVTTSWDDGHPQDLRLADLLVKYGIPATFYIPLANRLPVLSATEIRHLSNEFEIGAHTVNHCDLSRVCRQTARTEIVDSKAIIEDITGRGCAAFCFPKGRYRRGHLRDIHAAGYMVARTVELMSTSPPRRCCGMLVMPTSVQATPTDPWVFARNSLKRLKLRNLVRGIMAARNDWTETAEYVLTDVIRQGGVFHLWGHSWEIEAAGQWKSLQRLFRLLADCKSAATYLTNSDLALHSSSVLEMSRRS